MRIASRALLLFAATAAAYACGTRSSASDPQEADAAAVDASVEYQPYCVRDGGSFVCDGGSIVRACGADEGIGACDAGDSCMRCSGPAGVRCACPAPEDEDAGFAWLCYGTKKDCRE